MSVNAILNKMTPQTTRILQNHLDTWRKFQYYDKYRNHPEFKEISRFVAHWASNRKEVEDLSKVPSSVQGNIAYILQVIKHHNIIDNGNGR